MHELAITQSIVETITDRLPEARVSAVHLTIGKLAGVVPDSVSFCFDLVTKGTNLEGATLRIDQPAGTFRCLDCQAEFAADDLIALCGCGSADLTVLTGRELRITSVEVH